ncbi:hypothetical protein ACIBBE_48700, partial [Streptomyces sp. NPDC051644]
PKWKEELSQKRKVTFKGRVFPIGGILYSIRSGKRLVLPDFLKQLKDEGIEKLDKAKTEKKPKESWKDEEFLAALLQYKKENPKWKEELSQKRKVTFKGRVFPIGGILYSIRSGERKVLVEVLKKLKDEGIEKLDKAKTKTRQNEWSFEDFVPALLQYKKETEWKGGDLDASTTVPFEGRDFPIGAILNLIRSGDGIFSGGIREQLESAGVSLEKVERGGGKSAAVGAGDSGRPGKRRRGEADAAVLPSDQPPTAKPGRPGKRRRREQADAVRTPAQSPTDVPLPGEDPDPAGVPDTGGTTDTAGGLDPGSGLDLGVAGGLDTGVPEGLDLTGGGLAPAGIPGWDGGSWDLGGLPGLDPAGDGLDLTGVPKDLWDWILAWDGSMPGAAGTLTGPQAQTLQERGLRAVDVPHDGDCFFHALLRSGVDGVTAGDVRSVLARELRADLRRSPQVLWPQLDAQGQSGAAADEFRSLDGMPPQEIDAYLAVMGGVSAYRNEIQARVTENWSNRDREGIIASLETPGVYDDASGDIAPLAAAWIYNARINVITPEGALYTIGPHDAPREITLIRQDRSSGIPHDHWLATEKTSAP